MNHIELLHVRKVKAIEDIARIATDTALVGAKEDTVTVNDGDASRSILANHLLALVKLDILILEACNDMLGSGVIAKNAHVCGACGTAFLGINGEVHRVATRIHGVDMLVAIDDVVAKSERVNVKCHGLCPSSTRRRPCSDGNRDRDQTPCRVQHAARSSWRRTAPGPNRHGRSPARLPYRIPWHRAPSAYRYAS